MDEQQNADITKVKYLPQAKLIINGTITRPPSMLRLVGSVLLLMFATLLILGLAITGAFGSLTSMGISPKNTLYLISAGCLITGIGIIGASIKLFGPKGIMTMRTQAREISKIEMRLEQGKSTDPAKDINALVWLCSSYGDKTKADAWSRKLLEIVDEHDRL